MTDDHLSKYGLIIGDLLYSITGHGQVIVTSFEKAEAVYHAYDMFNFIMRMLSF